MKYKLIIAAIFALILSIREISAYKILGLFPYNGRSHIVMFKAVMRTLAERGHTVHVLSHYPLESPLANYTDLSVLGSVPLPNNLMPFHIFDYTKYDVLNIVPSVILYLKIDEHKGVMESEAVQKLLNSNERYDLIITESFVTDMTLGFVHKFKVPFIFLSSCGMPMWTSSIMANPQNPSFVPHFLSNFSPEMTFFQRFRNTIGLISNVVGWHAFMVPKNEEVMNQYFGGDMPPLLDIASNVSLIFTNTHPAVFGGRPAAPTVIDIGGIHIEPAKQLPHDIEKFIEDSPHGVIYFCMGSLLRAASLSEEKRNAFLYAFSKLKERVLWKFEGENIQTLDNVMIKEWMPQRDILAHPKVKLFISHGGLLGMLESISEGKPMVCIPMFGDQPMNVQALELQGMAKSVDYASIDNETIYEAIRETLKPQYATRAKEISKLFHDRQASPTDTVAYWTEYVIRNKGARNLRSSAVDLPFYQYLLIDVVLFSMFCSLASMILIYYVLRILFCSLYSKTASKNVKTKLK